MIAAATLALAERREWGMAAGVALVAHVAVAVLVLGWDRPAEPAPPEPVVLVELPPSTAPAPALDSSEPDSATPLETPARQPRPLPAITPPIELPPVRQPLPKDAATLPPPVPQPVRVAPRPEPAPAAAPAPAPAAAAAQQAAVAAATTAPGSSDPKARQREADYFALVSAHLNRRKVYPVEARKALQQGIVTVRFTVDRSGHVSGTSIKRSSGHAILDEATLALLQRVAPLPRMPASMQRDSITLSLPIDYSLRTS